VKRFGTFALRYLPETILIVLVLAYMIGTSFQLLLVPICVLLLLLFQLIFQFKHLGATMGSLLLVFSLFFFFATLAESSEFETKTANYFQLIIGGLTFFLLIVSPAIAMLYKSIFLSED